MAKSSKTVPVRCTAVTEISGAPLSIDVPPLLDFAREVAGELDEGLRLLAAARAGGSVKARAFAKTPAATFELVVTMRIKAHG